MPDPNILVSQLNRAMELHAHGRLAEAVAQYDVVIGLNPNIGHAHANRGAALYSLKRFDDALASLDRAIQLEPGNAQAYLVRGTALNALGRFDEALRNFDRGIKIAPDIAEAHNNKGIALKELNRLSDALASFDRALTINPGLAPAYVSRGNVLHTMRRLDEALENYDRAAQLVPDSADAYNNKGSVLQELGRADEALKCFDRAIALRPDYANAYNNKGNALQALRRLDDALAAYDTAIRLKPDYAEALCNKGLCLLLMERFDGSWPLYEWRKAYAAPGAFPAYPEPLWSGREDITGKTLFIHAEQGLGDTIQFCRFAKLAEARGARIILSVQDSLVRLLRAPAITIIGSKTPPPDFDFYIPLLSLPMAFGTDAHNIPASTPYLQAEPDLAQKWKDKIGTSGIRIGINWQGNRLAQMDVGRSFALKHLQPLSAIPDVRLISLQKNTGVEQMRDAGMTVETLGEEFDSGPDAFVDTAAVMANLDLVVTSDTAIAHLAGALGRPTWLALRYVPDWRWFLDRSDSPWYPGMKLFRQAQPGDWDSVFTRMAAELASRKA